MSVAPNQRGCSQHRDDDSVPSQSTSMRTVVHTSPWAASPATNASAVVRRLNAIGSTRSSGGSSARVASSSGGTARRETGCGSRPRAYRCNSSPWLPNRVCTSDAARPAKAPRVVRPMRRSRLTRSGASSASTGRSARNAADSPDPTTRQSWARRPPGRLLGGEQPVGDAEADVPDAQRDQPLGDDRPRLDLAAVEPGRHPQRAQAGTQRRHPRAELLDGDEDLLERSRVGLGTMIGERELGASRLGVAAAHPATDALGPRGRRARQH